MIRNDFNLLTEQVVRQGLCARCGICAGVCPVGAISFDSQRFPFLSSRCAACGFCVQCCPGGGADLPALSLGLFGKTYEGCSLQGRVENTYVAHAADAAVRQAGASGGLVTALLLFLLEKGHIDGAVIVGSDPEHPHLTKGILATTPEAIRNAAQSKYCVTPSMEVLRELRNRKGKFAVTALPCQIHGLRKLAQADPTLSKKIEVVFGLYCTCTMNPDGHLEALRAAGIREDDVARFHFRGGGWPGGMFVEKKDGTAVPLHASQSFGTVINTMFRLFGAERCRLCVDGLAEFADLSFGDFWAFDYSDTFNKLERCTLVSQRTGKGLEILQEAERAGAVVLYQLPENRVSQRVLSMVKGKRSRAAVYMAKRYKLGLPNPEYNVALPAPVWKDRKKSFSYLLFDLVRGTKAGRSFALSLLFAPYFGLFLHKLNRARMKFFANYHKS